MAVPSPPRKGGELFSDNLLCFEYCLLLGRNSNSQGAGLPSSGPCNSSHAGGPESALDYLGKELAITNHCQVRGKVSVTFFPTSPVRG